MIIKRTNFFSNLKKRLIRIEKFNINQWKKYAGHLKHTLLLCCIGMILLLCGGDGDPKILQSVFEGWERPVITWPKETEEPFDCETESMPSETVTAVEIGTYAETETNTETLSEEHSETDVLNPPSSFLRFEKRAPENGYTVYELVMTDMCQDGFTGLLMTVFWDSCCQVIEIRPHEHIAQMNFTYMIRDQSAAILLDGQKPIIKNDRIMLLYLFIKCNNKACDQKCCLRAEIIDKIYEKKS